MLFFDRRGVAGGNFSGRAKGRPEFCASAKGRARRAVLALPLALVLFASACQDPIRQAEAYALQAQALADGGDNRGALEAIQRAVDLRDDNAGYFLLLGSFRLRANDPVAAFNAFRRALELDAANVTALNFVANLGLQIGQVDEAERAADRLLTLNPRSIVGLQVKGLAALFRGNSKAADDFATKMLVISPSDEVGTSIRARTLVKDGKPEEALAVLDRAMLVSGRTPAMLITKLNVHRALRQPDAMKAIFVELGPQIAGSNSLKLDQINLFYKTGEIEKAREIAQSLLSGETPADPADYQTLVRLWSEYDPAPFDQKSIRKVRWNDPLAVFAVGRYLAWRGHYQVLSDLYFIQRAGIRPLFSSLRARALQGLQRSDGGKNMLGMVLEADADDVDAQIMRARAEQRAGRSSAALEAAQKAVSSDPNDPEAYLVLAEVNRAAKDNWRARQVFEDGLRQLPQSFLLIENYTRFLHELGDKGRAVSAARSFARTMPASVKAWIIYQAQCRVANDAGCLAEAEKGLLGAQTTYRLDDPPGTPTNRGLLSQF